MNDSPRVRSPRAPSIALDEAISKAIKVYERERRHAAPAEVVAQDMGYKSANSGSALAALASLRYYGLLERQKEGHYAASKELEAYQFAPSEDVRQKLLNEWVRRPQLFGELIERFSSGLPSDAALRFDLIQRGFTPESAVSVLSIFKRSIEFAKALEQPIAADEIARQAKSIEGELEGNMGDSQPPQSEEALQDRQSPEAPISEKHGLDRIPVRLPGNRRAWLEIPSPFYEGDKARLKAQIDLLLTDEINQ